MAKLPEAEARLFKNIFVCKKCKTKIRADPSKIRAEKIKCRGCNGKAFRPIKKK
ncbi:50S ribosomal protein L40e [Candidatus Woesearchaeota archaeon]|nr:50S ribosomal protein L40e [Candidatus Woesearchaeota archaeon]